MMERLIVVDERSPIQSKEELKAHILIVSNDPLSFKGPLWQIRWISLPYASQVCLILRVHQAVCDGIGLMSILVSQLADQAPPATTTFIRTCHGTMTATSCEYNICDVHGFVSFSSASLPHCPPD